MRALLPNATDLLNDALTHRLTFLFSEPLDIPCKSLPPSILILSLIQFHT
ncbi:MAG: hypothetical protein JWR68_1272 [Polaromonas sp.]|nr:hypothetical protein [Polaromonas sp.]